MPRAASRGVRSKGGLDVPSNLVAIGWLSGHDCGLPIVHAKKWLWPPLLLGLLASELPHTGLQVERWFDAGDDRQASGWTAGLRDEVQRVEQPGAVRTVPRERSRKVPDLLRA